MQFFYVAQSYVVYLSILAVMYLSCKVAISKRKFSIVVLGLLFYSLLFGLRYGVGKDCISYIKMYENLASGYIDDRIEIGYTLLMQLFSWLEMPTWVFMGAVALIQVIFVFLFFRKRKNVLPFLALTFILGCVWLKYANGMRQTIAFSLFVYSLCFLENKRLLIHYLLILLAVAFHRSALLLLLMYPAYLLLSKDILSRKKQYILLAVAIVLGNIGIIKDLMDYIEQGAILLGYGGYFDYRYADKLLAENQSVGVGYYIALVISVFIIYHSKKIAQQGPVFSFIYNLYFIGILLKHAFIFSQLIQRVNYYFLSFDLIIEAVLLWILYKKADIKGYYLMIVLLLLTLVGTLYRMFENDSAFFFIWQVKDYLKYTIVY